MPVNNSYVYNNVFYGGGVIGVGGYLFNIRDVETLKGWSLMLLIGVEINLKIIYNINRGIGFFVSPHLGAYGFLVFLYLMGFQ